MKMRKSSILIIGIRVLLLSSITVSAETESDAQGDVWHFAYPYWQEQTVSNQPNIDIKEIKAEFSGDQITLSMTLWPGGTFSPSGYGERVMYAVFFNTSDAIYTLPYTISINETGGTEAGGFATGISTTGAGASSGSKDITVTANTISVTLDKAGEDTTKVKLWGTSWMHAKYGGEQYLHDSWYDWVGDFDPGLDIGPGDGDGDGQQKPPTGTPGFEAIAVIAAFGIALIILRRKRK